MLEIPVTLLNDRRLERRLTPETIRDVLVDMVKRYLYTELPLEELIAMDDPEERATRRTVKAVFDKTDKVPRHELRHMKACRWSQSGLTDGTQPVGRFIQSADMGYQRNLAQLRSEQPNCDWKLVAATVEQVDTTRVSQDGGSSEGSLNGTPDPDVSRANRTRPSLVRVSNHSNFTATPDIRWLVGMVFADVARAELMDPNLHNDDGKPGPMSEYVVTRRIRHMPRTLRENRERAVEFLQDFHRRSGELSGGLLTPKFSEDQLAEIRALRTEGFAPARIAKVLGVTLEEVEQALA